MTALGESLNGHSAQPLRLAFDAGTLVVEGLREDEEHGLPGVKYDFRTRQFRAEAIWYRTIVEQLRGHKREYLDAAALTSHVGVAEIQVAKEAFPHQGRGPESLVGERRPGHGRPADRDRQDTPGQSVHRAAPAGPPWKVITPTIDLMNQWYDELVLSFGASMGMWA